MVISVVPCFATVFRLVLHRVTCDLTADGR